MVLYRVNRDRISEVAAKFLQKLMRPFVKIDNFGFLRSGSAKQRKLAR